MNAPTVVPREHPILALFRERDAVDAKGGHELAPAGRWYQVGRNVVVTTDHGSATYMFDFTDQATQFTISLESINLGFIREKEFAHGGIHG